jgi:hypothetical protein
MSIVEREFFKSVDDVILNASGKTLKKLQELDMKTQLHTNTFYDAYSSFHEVPKKEKILSATKPFRKNKLK